MSEIEYTGKNMITLSFKEAIRTQIDNYLDSADNEGTYQALKEIINNSTDEANNGFGNIIEIKLNPNNNSISVRDYGRGLPFDNTENGENALIAACTKQHTGAKMKGQGTAYKISGGVHGLGLKCVCLSADDALVESIRDGKKASLVLKKGEVVSYNETSTKEKNGTLVQFNPDHEVFYNDETKYDFKRICEMVELYSFLNSGITFVVENLETKEKHKYYSTQGLNDYIKSLGAKPLHSHIINGTASDESDSVEIAFQWNNKKEKSIVFVNGLLVPEGGTPVTGAKTAITKTFNNLTKKDFDGDIIRSNLTYVIKCNVREPSFGGGQSKSKVQNANLRTLASNAFTEALKQMQLKYKDEFNTITEYLNKVAKADAAAEKARQIVLNHEKEFIENSKKKIVNADKLRDARKLGQDSILLVCEGLSAGGSMSIGRDPEKYGILMLRGKAKNLLNCTIDEGLENEEVKLMLQALGFAYGKFINTSKLRYGKVAIAADADPDGGHIGLLIMAMLDVLCPELIKENRLYWLKAPICKVATKNKNYYYYNEDELKGHPNGEITYYKGLGQMSDQDLKESMFSSEWQRLEPITYSDIGMQVLEELMGKDIEPRKEFVFNNIDFSQFTIE